MAILVTGCAGFIGSNVCRTLLDDGETVMGIDNLTDSYDVRVKNWRLDQLRDCANFSFDKTDISDPDAMRSQFKAHCTNGGPPFTGILNLGGRAGVRHSSVDPWGYIQANTTGTLTLLELCHEFGVPKFVLASTSSVYGDDAPQPFKEDCDTSRPLSPYAASKKAAEAFAYTYHHLYGIDSTILRYFTVYGPAGRPDMSMFTFTKAIAEGLPITVFGDGTQRRDFTYVDDIVNGTIAALKPLGYEIINLGSDSPITVNELISMIEDCLEKKALVNHAPMHPADVKATWADISKAQAVLGWRPQVPIEEGVRRSVAWYQQNREWAKEVITS